MILRQNRREWILPLKVAITVGAIAVLARALDFVCYDLTVTRLAITQVLGGIVTGVSAPCAGPTARGKSSKS
jgi:hypothetical protein